ncbi:hypothetical protein VNI00_017996 [Paramarasmius palmivorus]|uniref:Uncharacterized protein n=1 Tax=Paramarasmius palmivorus TaxID=297713 RepID=A0AAW0B188_9AGAR
MGPGRVYAPRLSSSSPRLGFNEYQFLDLIKTASGDELLRSGNQEFSNMYKELLDLRAEKKALNNIALPQQQQQTQNHNDTKRSKKPSSVSTVNALLERYSADDIERRDYSECSFPTSEAWTTHREQYKSRTGKELEKLGFSRRRRGKQISDRRRHDMSDSLYTAFSVLYGNWAEPSQWKRRSDTALTYVLLYMVKSNDYYELGLCDGWWKVDKLCSVRYSDWKRDRMPNCKRFFRPFRNFELVVKHSLPKAAEDEPRRKKPKKSHPSPPDSTSNSTSDSSSPDSSTQSFGNHYF